MRCSCSALTMHVFLHSSVQYVPVVPGRRPYLILKHACMLQLVIVTCKPDAYSILVWSVVTTRRLRRTLACGTLAQAWSSPGSAPATVLEWIHPSRHGEGLAARWPRGCRSEVVHLPARRCRPLRGQPHRRAARGSHALRSRLLRICTQTYSLSLSSPHYVQRF
jgi:hypothetical protein